MIQTSFQATGEEGIADRARPIIWGLSAVELHDAYWRALGVQCIRRGKIEPLQKGADLYLLIEPDQLVLFDVRDLAERLSWRAAKATRLRVIDQDTDTYSERVEVDDEGYVTRIGRRYRPRTHASYRVILTRKKRIAKIWMYAEARQHGWRGIRHAAGSSNIDNFKCEGGCYSSESLADEHRLLDKLVECWPRPDRVINGLQAWSGGVWLRTGDTLPEDAIAIGPAWLGRAGWEEDRSCVIGPVWKADRYEDLEQPRLPALGVRDIQDIDPGDAPIPQEAVIDPIGPIYGFFKRGMDIALSLFGLIAGAPVFLILMLLVYISDGRPIFYGGLRQTTRGRNFRCWKFRTMYRNADEIKHTLAKQNAADGPQFFMEEDPRVFRIGRIFRRYHLDELPQLLNVLLGQMSMVGPRPSPDEENQKCPAWREIRLSILPGIAGLWQLNRTREPGLDFQEWIRYDIEYVERAGFFLDLKILFATFWTIVGKSLQDASDKKR